VPEKECIGDDGIEEAATTQVPLVMAFQHGIEEDMWDCYDD
jgi:hypothetical protein